jgi:hypothetical protein
MIDAPDKNTGKRGGARDDSTLILGAGTPAPRPAAQRRLAEVIPEVVAQTVENL